MGSSIWRPAHEQISVAPVELTQHKTNPEEKSENNLKVQRCFRSSAIILLIISSSSTIIHIFVYLFMWNRKSETDYINII